MVYIYDYDDYGQELVYGGGRGIKATKKSDKITK